MAMPLITLPKLEDLPLALGNPPSSAWGLWSSNGFDDQLGSLNYLTDATVLQAMKTEVQTGERIGLNLPLDLIDPPLLGRVGFSKKIIRKDPRVINDDVVRSVPKEAPEELADPVQITFNTQGSSQWDSFRHFAYQKQAKFYGGVQQDDIHCSNTSNPINGLSAWSARCIAGRAALIDYASYAEENSITYNPLGTAAIHLEAVQAIAQNCNIAFQQGDILLLRTGFLKAYKTADMEMRREFADTKPPRFCGLGQGRDTTEWLWQRQFAAVAADSPGFECSPAVDPDWHLHPILLAGWGTPIGELFDLEALAEICKKNQRWSFFLTSAPLNYEGAVASPPNAIAFF